MLKIILTLVVIAISYRFFQSKNKMPPPQGKTESLSQKEALQILGLHDNPSQAEIQTAYKRLMSKIHPDKGGSDYLAKQINQAFSRLTDDKNS